MAQVTESNGGQQRSLSKRPRASKTQIRVDMTPMVDLGFLLISFFMLTVVMGEETAIRWNKPIDNQPPIDVSDCQVLNLLIDSNERVFAYTGTQTEDMQVKTFNRTNGVRQLVLNRGKQVKANCGNYKSGKPRELICLIKLLPGARYKSMIDVLDEMEITNTQTYAIQEPLPYEVEEVTRKGKLLANN